MPRPAEGSASDNSGSDTPQIRPRIGSSMQRRVAILIAAGSVGLTEHEKSQKVEFHVDLKE